MIEFIDGVHDISNEDYHSSKGISRSQLMLLNQSPYHFWYKIFSGKYVKENATPAMNIGQIFHVLLLEPDKFDSEFVVMPQLDRRTKNGKEEYKQFILGSSGRTVITTNIKALSKWSTKLTNTKSSTRLLKTQSLSNLFIGQTLRLDCSSNHDQIFGHRK